MEATLALCRFAHFLAAMLAFGTSAYLWLLAPAALCTVIAAARDRQRDTGAGLQAQRRHRFSKTRLQREGISGNCGRAVRCAPAPGG